ncbi:PPOX class F420-dependent oxidoreductase [Streptosporangium sp. KLBMP 9127]|nr:PPOX class F420-dependent oxidoreductase [Streptosporangium sp. KLBMP 9127]
MPPLPEDVRKLYDGPNFATITSLNVDGSAQSTVIWVKTDGDDILFSTVKGRLKHRNFERDPRASLLVIDPDDPYNYATVRGRVAFTDDPGGTLIQELSGKYLGVPWTKDQPDVQRVIARVTPDQARMRH